MSTIPMAEADSIEKEITGPARGTIEPDVDIEMLIIDGEETDNSQQPVSGVKRKLTDKPPLPSPKKTRCPPKADPNNANNRRRAEVWNHVIESPKSTPLAPKSLCTPPHPLSDTQQSSNSICCLALL